MRKVEYRCFFGNDWSDFMDGELFVDGESAGPVDFVSDYEAEEGDLVLVPFTEDEARKYFADAGYPDVVFVYG